MVAVFRDARTTVFYTVTTSSTGCMAERRASTTSSSSVRHHHLVHEGGWSIARNEVGEWTFADPAGKAVRASEASQAWTGTILTWLQEWADEHGLDLGPAANEPLWDGTRPDYDLAVAGLMAGA